MSFLNPLGTLHPHIDLSTQCDGKKRNNRVRKVAPEQNLVGRRRRPVAHCAIDRSGDVSCRFGTSDTSPLLSLSGVVSVILSGDPRAS